MTRVAIVGGGTSGLAAAFELEERRRAGAEVEYVLTNPRRASAECCAPRSLTDASWRLGRIFSSAKNRPPPILPRAWNWRSTHWSNDANRKTYILTRGRLVELPDGLMFLVPTKILPTALSPLFSWATKLRMAAEFLHPPRAVDRDESVAGFVTRHYGHEMVDRLADPLLSGVYGGDAAQRNVRAVLARFADMERSHGSLGRAMGAEKMRSGRAGRKPLFTSMKKGMEHLAEKIVSRLTPSALDPNAPVQAIELEAGRWVVSTEAQSDAFDFMILALPGRRRLRCCAA